MRIHLPAETWVEILEWLDYREFVKKMESEKLWDREFSPIVRDWLHDWHKDVKIGSLRFIAEQFKDKNRKVEKRACLQKCFGCAPMNQRLQKVPIAEVALPRNIKSFNSICVSYLDPTVMGFLHQMRPLLSQVHLTFDQFLLTKPKYCRRVAPPYNLLDEYLTALELLLPQITGPLESLTIYHEMLHLFHDHFPAVLASAKMLIYHPQVYYGQLKAWQAECLANWLFSPPPPYQGEGSQPQPRKLGLYYLKQKCLTNFVAEIRERFQAPNRLQSCSSFFVLLPRFSVMDTRDENVTTGEQLVLQKLGNGQVLISCNSNTEGKERIAQLERELLQWHLDQKDRKVYVWSPEFGPQMEVKKAKLKRDRKPVIRFGFGEEEASTSQEANITSQEAGTSAKRKKLSSPTKKEAN